MAKKQRIEQQPTPVSGERVMMPPARSTYGKAPKDLTPEQSAQIKGAAGRRKAWEKTDVGQERTRSGDNGLFGPGANKAQVYAMNAGPAHDPGPRHYDVQLPGMVDPNAAPRPPKWEELSDAHRAHAERSLAKYGTSVQQMSKDYGAQLDQAHKRAWDAGESRPWSEDFYTVGEPRKVLEQSARDLGIPHTIHAQMNAFTSPNTKFSQESGGETVYPNDRAATHAVKWVQQGGDPNKITNEFDATGMSREPGERAQGYTTNIRKAASSFDQWQKGVDPPDWTTGAKGGGPFDASPKTGPYANSWSDSHPQFFVSDVHSGGGGGVPHLSSDKPILKHKATGEPVLDDKGKPKRDKSERERAIESVPYFHSAMDYAARSAHNERGISHVRSGQAAQWGEEQIQRKMKGGPTHDKVYPPKSSTSAVSYEQFRML
jgi:hypothetical protein